MRELTAADVGLLHDPKAVSPTYLICHYFTNTMFHAGDGIVFDTHEGNTYYGLAPIEGKIIESVLVNQKVGYEITVETPYLYQGKRVYYDLVHSSGLVSGLSDGSWVNKGDPIVFINKSYGAGGSIKELSLDIAIRNGPKGANSQRSNWQPYSYFSFLQFLYDFTFR